MGRAVTFPRLFTWTTVSPVSPNHNVYALAVRQEPGVGGQLVALTTGQDHAIFAANSATGGSAAYDVYGLAETLTVNNDPYKQNRKQWVTANNTLYWTSLLTPLQKWSGESGGAGTYLAQQGITSGPWYAAKYLDIFHRHLVMANVSSSEGAFPARFAWSDINDYTDFQPTSTNEADFFDLDDGIDAGPFGLSITGMGVVGDVLAVYTVDSIWIARYVGFDAGVILTEKHTSGVGSAFPYGVVKGPGIHFFISRGDFHMFDGVQVQSIGAPVRQFFFGDKSTAEPGDLSTHERAVAAVWGWNLQSLGEIWWFYPSYSSAGFACDSVLIFNYLEGKWYRRGARNISAALESGITTYRWIDLLVNDVATIDGLTGSGTGQATTIDGLAYNYTHNYNIFGLQTGITLIREEFLNAQDDLVNYITNDTLPYLVTPDFDYGDPQAVKEIDTIYMDAYGEYGGAETLEEPAHAVKVYYSVRDHYSDPVSFTLAGTWTSVLTQKRLSVPRLAGRIFRFKLEFQPSTNSSTYDRVIVQFFAFAENVYNEQQEQ